MANNATISGLSIDLTELSVDTTPQLGGNLDLNSNNITGTGNINITGTITGSSFSGDGSSLSGINTDLVSDTTPQLGGNLDLNGNNITGTGNIPAANLTGTLPALDGSNLTGVGADLVDDTTPQLGGDLDTNGNDVTFGDNDKAQFGAGNDLQIYHDGSNSYVSDQGTGGLFLQGTGNVIIEQPDGTNFIQCNSTGWVRLHHGGSNRLETTSTGLSVTGNILPEANGTRDLGSASLRWQNIYTSDLNLNNGVGNYTIVEGEEDLFLYNNKSGKVFKFALIEVDPSEATPKIEDLKNGSSGAE